MRIALFITCLADALFPDVGKATVRLLERLGHEVDFPAAQTCCGQMHINTGYQPEALPLVRHFVETFEPYEAIVAPSGSCVGSVRHQHAMVARGQGDEALARRAEAVAERTYELSELLVDVLGVEDVGAYYPHRVTYHPTCHSLRMLRVGDKPLRLLRNVRGMTLLELPAADQCCGFGGTFALKNAETSTAMLADKMRNVLATGAEALTAGDSSCLMHIGGGLCRLRSGTKTVHLAEILASTDAPAPDRASARRCGCPRTRRAGDHQQPPHAGRDRREPGMTRIGRHRDRDGAPAPADERTDGTHLPRRPRPARGRAPARHHVVPEGRPRRAGRTPSCAATSATPRR